MNKKRVKQYGEVFTPEWLVNDMLDLVQSQIERLDSLFLEPACGTGNFLVEILRRKMRFAKSENDILVCVRSLYGIELLKDNAEICRNRLLSIVRERSADEQTLRMAENIIQKNIVCGNALDERSIFFTDWKTGKVFSLAQLTNRSASRRK